MVMLKQPGKASATEAEQMFRFAPPGGGSGYPTGSTGPGVRKSTLRPLKKPSNLSLTVLSSGVQEGQPRGACEMKTYGCEDRGEE